MRVLILFFSFLVTCNMYGQESLLYNSDGKLKIDTTLCIESSSLAEMVKIEQFILPTLYNRLDYPENSRENGNEGILIIEVTIGAIEKSIEWRSLECEIIKGVDPWIDKSVIKAIYCLKSSIIYIVEDTEEFNFYIPFIFELEKSEFEENLKRNGAVTKKATLNTMQRVLIK